MYASTDVVSGYYRGQGSHLTCHTEHAQEPCSLSDLWFLTAVGSASLHIALTLWFPPPATPIPLGSLSLSFFDSHQHVAVPMGLVAPRLNVSPKVVQSWQSMSSMSLSGLLITAGHRTISGQNCYLSVHMHISLEKMSCQKLAVTLLFFVGEMSSDSSCKRTA